MVELLLWDRSTRQRRANEEWQPMINKNTGTDYRGLCPNGQKEYFHEHATELVASSIHWGNVERNIKAPSRIKGELEHLAKVISKLSPRAKTSMDYNAKLYHQTM